MKANLKITATFTISNADASDNDAVNAMVTRNLEACLNMLALLLHGKPDGNIEVEFIPTDAIASNTLN